ncbi:MAG: DNA-methyltransferase [Planctomycetota bacterium]
MSIIQVHHQSAFEPWPLEASSVQAIITSPPYWGLRKYDIPDVIIGGALECEHEYKISEHKDKRGTQGCTLDGTDINKTGANRLHYTEGFCIHCGAWTGQHGLEPSMELYLEHTALWLEEARRVLRPDGLMFLNLGDTYGGSWGAKGKNGRQNGGHDAKGRRLEQYPEGTPPAANYPARCKMMIPHRIAINMVDTGWICRNDIVWHKPNGIPGSMKSRFITRHENVFMFSRSSSYYFDLDAVREPYKPDTLGRSQRKYVKSGVPGGAMPDGRRLECRSYELHKKGANPGDVWTISGAKAAGVNHYAMFPEQLAERMVKCSSRPGDLVLDPFCGTGTTLRVSDRLGRRAVGIDMGYKDVQAARLSEIQRELM